MYNTKILSCGHYIPAARVTNKDLEKVMNTTDEWIVSRTGIEARHYSLDEDTSSMAYKAAAMAIENANIDLSELACVICATISPDDFMPSVACKVIKQFGVGNVMAFDINAACSGFIYALNVASSILQSSDKKYALVIGCERLSNLLDYEDRSTSILFGDGAGACILEKTEGQSYFYCMAKPDITNSLYATGLKSHGLFQNSFCDSHYIKMNGQEVYRFAVTAFEDAIVEVLKQANLELDNINYIVPHQANIRIIQSVVRKMKINQEKIVLNLQEYGNTSAASIAIALSEGIAKKKMKKGDKIMLVGFGGGLTWASTIIEL